MIQAFVVLVGCQLLGEVLRRVLHLPLPGPLIGMVLLAVALSLRRRRAEPTDDGRAASLPRVADGLIGNMGLLFVPAGVGVITELGVVQRAWLPLLAGVLISTVLGLIVTGVVMNRVTRRLEARALSSGGATP